MIRLRSQQFFFYFFVVLIPLVIIIYLFIKKLFKKEQDPDSFGKKTRRFVDYRGFFPVLIDLSYFIMIFIFILSLLIFILEFSILEIIIISIIAGIFLFIVFFYLISPGEIIIFSNGVKINNRFYSWRQIEYVEKKKKYSFINRKNVFLKIRLLNNRLKNKNIFPDQFESCFNIVKIYTRNRYEYEIVLVEKKGFNWILFFIILLLVVILFLLFGLGYFYLVYKK
jgi:hypothetical protein